jgi:hypothetical protein
MKTQDLPLAALQPDWMVIVDEGRRELWRGDALSIEIIFNCLAGLNFEGDRYTQYIAWMVDFAAKAWPGRPNPYVAGARITLLDSMGRDLRSHVFR